MRIKYLTCVETAELLVIDEVEGAIRSPEAEDGQLGKSDVEEKRNRRE